MLTEHARQLIRSTIDQLPLAVAIFDRDLRFVACSRQFFDECDLAADPVGRHFHDVFPGTGERWTKLLERGVAGESLSADYDPFVWAAGTVSWLKWEMKPWRPTSEEIEGVMVTVKIVNEDAQVAATRSEIEQKLRTEHEHYCLMERRHRTILELSNDIMLVCSFSGLIFDTNSATQRLLGIDVLKMDPDSLLSYVHPLDRQLLVESLRNSIESGRTSIEVSIRCRRNDNTYRWLDWSFSLLFEYDLILGVARDVTDERAHQDEQEHMLTALSRSQERLRQAERIAAIGYWESNLDGSEPHFSEGVYNIYGLPGDYTITSLQDLWSFTYDNRYGACIQGIRHSLQTGAPFEFEYDIQRPDGEVRTLYGRGQPLYDQAGTMIKLQGIIQDITMQVLADRALREREQQLAEAQHIARIGSWQWDIASDTVTWSQEMYLLLGYEIGEVKPSYDAFLAKVPAAERATVQAEINITLQQKIPAQYRHRVQLPNGEMRTFHVRHRPHVDANGEVATLEGTSQDITEMLEVESMLARQAEQLARSNQDLARFASVASHDLREPLRKVKSFTELLAHRYGDQLDERGREWVRHIVEDTGRMQSLIQDVLAYSQLISDRDLHEPTDLNQTFAQACTALYSAIETANADVTAGPLPTVSANPVQMSQLMQNLLENALKYRSRRRPIIHVQAWQNGEFWHLEVSDNGIGIDLSQQNRIFEMFGRLHRSDQHEGNGMGLAVCKKIVEGHGGHIGMTSEVDQGSTFWFTLPVLNSQELTAQDSVAEVVVPVLR